MKAILFLFLSTLTWQGLSQNWEWVKQPPNTGSGDLCFATGPNGTSYLSVSYPSYNGQDCFLFKQINGNPAWNMNLGPDIQIKSLESNTNGDIFFGGVFRNTIVINGALLTSAGQSDAFLIKMDAQGQTVWMKTFASAYDDVCNNISFDQVGNLLITGSLGNNAIIDGIAYPSKGLFICKYDQSGSLLNVIRSTNGGQGLEVKSDSLNNIYLLGTVATDTLYLDTVIAYPPYYYYPNNFVVKFDSVGNYKGYVGAGNGMTFELEPSGNFYVLERSYYYSSFIRRYNPSLTKIWQKSYAGCNSACLNARQELCVTGAVFNYSDSTYSWYWKYDRNGNILDEAFTNKGQYINGRLIKTDDQDNLYVIGNCSPQTDFGNIHINLNPGQNYFLGKIKGKKPFADFNFKQLYEVQTINYKSNCLNDTAMRWVLPGGTPSISYEKNPVVTYSSPGLKTAILIAFNGFSSDTMIRQVQVRPEPLDTIYTKLFDQASWGGGSTPVYNKTSDGGFIIGPGLYKYNHNGSLEWRVSNAFGYYPGYVTQINSGYITLSNSSTLISSNFGVDRPYVVKTDHQGNVLWAKDYKDSLLPYGCSTTAFGLCETYEGGFMYGGSAVVKSDSAGNILWQRIYPIGITNVLRHTNGTYVLQGLKFQNGVNNSFVAQIKGDGTLNWMKGYSNTGNSNINNTIICQNKDIAIIGNLGNTGSQESYILRLDSTGNLKWAKTYKVGEFWLSGVADVGSGKLMLTGNLGGWSNTRQVVVMLLDQNGALIWNRVTDINDHCMSHGIIGEMNGHAFLFGTMNQNNFLSRLNLLPPPCMIDSVIIQSSTRLVSLLTSTVQIDTMHYATTDAYSYQPQATAGLLPTIQCTTSSGLITSSSPEEGPSADEILVFPNPSLGIFKIVTNNLRARISIYDVLGNYVLNQASLGNIEMRVDLSNQPKGIYFVEVLSGHQKTVRKISLQ